MPISVLLRSPAVWISPVLSILAVLATSYTNIPVKMPEPYPLALTAAGMTSVFLVAPVCAACAAWEGGRLRRAGWYDLPHTRSTIMIGLVSIVPSLVVGLVAISVAVAYKFPSAGVIFAPDARIVAKSIAVIVAHTLLGFALGVRLPAVVAASSILLIGYTWMVLPIGLSPLWLRHLNGTWVSCCGLSTDVAPRAFAGVIAVAAGIAGTAVFLMRQHMNAFRLGLSAVPVTLGLGVGIFLVQGMGSDPVVARSGWDLVCSSSQPQVCVWPEHDERLQEVTEIAVQASEAWQSFGIAVPTLFTEERSAVPPNARSFGFSLESSRSHIIGSLAKPTISYHGALPWRCLF